MQKTSIDRQIVRRLPPAAVPRIFSPIDHPSDFPDVYVARRFDIVRGAALMTDHTMTSPDLDQLRNRLMEEAACTDRLPRDRSLSVASAMLHGPNNSYRRCARRFPRSIRSSPDLVADAAEQVPRLQRCLA